VSLSDKTCRTFAINTRTFVLQSAPEVSPSEKLISSATVLAIGSHEHVSIWNRGCHAGDLVMKEGDGVPFAIALGLVEVDK